MKKLIIVIIMISSSLFAQEMSYIFLKSGDVLTGRIIENIPDEYIKVRFHDGTILTYQFDEISSIEPIPVKKNGSLGVGLGIPYGIFGVNAEVMIVKNINITGGIGSTLLAGIGYSVGMKLYLKEAGSTWRPRLSAYFGTNGVLEVIVLFGDDIEEVHEGITLGAGMQWMWGDSRAHGLDFDILYIASSGIFDRTDKLKEELFMSIENLGRVKVSVGYRYAF